MSRDDKDNEVASSLWPAVAEAYVRAPLYVKLFLGGIVVFVIADMVLFVMDAAHYRNGSSAYELAPVFLAFVSVRYFRLAGVFMELVQIVWVLHYPVPADTWGMISYYWAHAAITLGVLAIPAHHLPLIGHRLGFVALDAAEKSEKYLGED